MSVLQLPVPTWGDRISLLPKRMGYVLSLELTATMQGRLLTVQPGESALSHLLGHEVVTMPDGARCDLPTIAITHGAGRLGTVVAPDAPVLSLQLSGTTDNGNSIVRIDATGALDLPAAAVALAPERPCFVATRAETSSATFRWLNRRQLFGMGRTGWLNSGSGLCLRLSFDLYAAA